MRDVQANKVNPLVNYKRWGMGEMCVGKHCYFEKSREACSMASECVVQQSSIIMGLGVLGVAYESRESWPL